MGLAGYFLAVWDSGPTLEHRLAGISSVKLLARSVMISMHFMLSYLATTVFNAHTSHSSF